MDRNDAVKIVIVVVHAVALRKESVDRNCYAGDCTATQTASLSARRAWIEILMQCQVKKYSGVALRKESVDRNLLSLQRLLISSCRSPQGERG